jgi:hypothetical protein
MREILSIGIALGLGLSSSGESRAEESPQFVEYQVVVKGKTSMTLMSESGELSTITIEGIEFTLSPVVVSTKEGRVKFAVSERATSDSQPNEVGVFEATVGSAVAISTTPPLELSPLAIK